MNKAILTQKLKLEITDELLIVFKETYELKISDLNILKYIVKDLLDGKRKTLGDAKELQENFSIEQYEIYKEFRKNNYKDSSSENFFKAKYGDNWKQFKQEKDAKCAGTLKNFIKKYGLEEGTNRYNDTNKLKSITLENMIRLYGQEEGNKRWEHFCERNKGNFTLERAIELYGIIEGTKKYNKTRSKLKNKNTLSYYIERFGKNEGTKKYEERNKKNSETTKQQIKDGVLRVDTIRLDYNIEKYGLEEGTRRYKEKCNSISVATIKLFSNEEYKTKFSNIMKEIAPKIRMSNEKNGHWVPLDKLSEWDLYCYKVDKITAEQNIDTLKDRDKWGVRAHNPEAYELDHIISKKFGFDNNIPPEIIGDISNLQFIHWLENAEKSRNCYSAVFRD